MKIPLPVIMHLVRTLLVIPMLPPGITHLQTIRPDTIILLMALMRFFQIQPEMKTLPLGFMRSDPIRLVVAILPLDIGHLRMLQTSLQTLQLEVVPALWPD